jgi:hypothetical protein
MKAKALEKISIDVTHLSEDQRSQFKWLRQRGSDDSDQKRFFAVWPKGFVFEGEQAAEMIAAGFAEEVTE